MKASVTLGAGLGCWLGMLLASAPVLAFNFGDVMSPGRWLDGGGNRYRDDGPYDGYAPPPPYGGYGYAPAPYGYAPQGYAVPGHSAPSGYVATPQAPVAPSNDASQQRIRELEHRIEELERGRQASSTRFMPTTKPAPAQRAHQSAPVFSPIR